MTSNLQVFRNSEFGELNVLIIDGKEYFPATDCARMLGYSDPYDAINRHTKGSVKHRVLTSGGEQEIKFIPEGDLYRLIVKSKLPSAEKFERWVFDEVLPTIRKHGVYATNDAIEKMLKDPDTMIKTLQALKEQREKVAQLKEVVKDQDEKLKFFRNLQKLNEMLRASDIGAYYGITAKEFNRIMQDVGVIKKIDSNIKGRKIYYVMTSKYSHTKYCQVITETLDNGKRIKTNVWTPDSLEFIDEIMNQYGYSFEI